MNANLAVAGLNGIPDGVKLFGRMAWWSLSEDGANLSKFRRAWAGEGLQADLLPKDTQSVHRFQNACRSVESKRASKADSSRMVEITVTSVKEDSTECVYQIDKLVRDKDKRLVEHPKALRVVFEKTYETISFDVLDARHASELEGLKETIRNRYEAAAKILPSQKVRALLREYLLNKLNGTHMGGGSPIYFVPEAGASSIESLQKVVTESMTKGHLYQLPVMQIAESKEMLREVFEEATVGEANAFLAEVSSYLKQNRIPRKDKLANLISRNTSLRQKLISYRQMLASDLDHATAAADLVADELMDLLAASA